MICSQNEIASMLYKASVGSGRSVGLAQDIARAGVWLCCNGHQGVAVTLEHLRSEPRNPSWPAMLEIVAAGASSETTIDGVGDALMLQAMAAVLGSDNEIGYEVQILGELAKVSCGPAQANEVAESLGPIDVPDSDVAAARELAARTYVPATDGSRIKGAGAGLTDND